MKYILKPKTVAIPAAFIDRLRQESLNGGRRVACGVFALEFQDIPALLIWDILDGRATLEAGAEEAVILWDGPVGPPEEYLHDWKAFCLNINGPKLDWLEAMLGNADMMNDTIPTRRMPQERRPEFPRLEVSVEKHAAALLVNFFRISGQLVRDLPCDSALFMPNGEGWYLDNVDAAWHKHEDPTLVDRELKEKPLELPEADE